MTLLATDMHTLEWLFSRPTPRPSGALDSGPSFNNELGTAMTSLGAHHARLFTPDAGTLRDQTFLIVDLNGAPGYQAGADLVLHLVDPTGSLSASVFI